MFEVVELAIPGCVLLRPRVHEDERGRFVKVFHAERFAELGLESDWRELFLSVSRRGVLRGLHYQAPPDDHAKLVWVSSGRILDAALDLRASSPTFGEHVRLELDAETAGIVYLPRGIAHGFLALEDGATVHYATSCEHAPSADLGIRWDTAGIPWPADPSPIVSPRDRAHPTWQEYALAPRFRA